MIRYVEDTFILWPHKYKHSTRAFKPIENILFTIKIENQDSPSLLNVRVRMFPTSLVIVYIENLHI